MGKSSVRLVLLSLVLLGGCDSNPGGPGVAPDPAGKTAADEANAAAKGQKPRDSARKDTVSVKNLVD